MRAVRFFWSSTGRVDALNAVVRQVAAATPGERVDDFAHWLADRPGGELDPRYRTNGVGLTPAAAAAGAGSWAASQAR